MDWIKPVQFSSLILTLFALATGALIAGTYLVTKDRIIQQERIAQAEALLEIMPQDTHDNLLIDDKINTNDKDYLNLYEPSHIYIARQSGNIVGMLIPSIAPDGYSGDIHIITGIKIDGSIAGVRILAHNETPGLGDKVETKKSDWVFSFNGKSLQMPTIDQWAVKKDKGVFDQFTGATITPRAVTKAVSNTLLFFKDNKVALLAEANTLATVQETNSVR